MKSQQVLVTQASYSGGRPNSHFPEGANCYIDLAFPSSKEAIEFLELVRGNKVWISDEKPLE